MKILAIGHSYVIDSNRQFWNQAAHYTEHEIDLIVPASWQSNLVKNVVFTPNQMTDSWINQILPISVFFSGNGSFYHYQWINFFKKLNAKKYDSIFIFQETWSFSLAQLIFLKQFTLNRSTPIHLAVCQNIIKPKLAWLIPWERLLAIFVRRIWFCTYEILKVLDYKRIKNSTDYLPFTFDHELYVPHIKKPENKLRIGYMGRLTEEKGLDTLLDACRILKKMGKEIELHLAGAGPLEKKLSEDFIHFHGLIPHREAHHFYQKCDIFILPSKTKKFWKEQFGRVLVESTASGTPVIGSSSGAIPEVIGKIGFGEVFQESSSEDLKDKILILWQKMSESDYVANMQQAINKTIHFSSHRDVAKMLLKQIERDLNR